MADDTTPGSAPDTVAGWAGLLVPYDQPSVDGRIIRRPPGGARIRDLPVELKFQESATGGHDNATIGLASITRTWETDDGLWGSGPFDLADPRGKELARKVHEGFVGHVSVDLGDFKTSAQQTPRGMVEAVTDWKLLSTTIVADAAMDGARIFTVADPDQITPMSQVMTARRESAGVFAAADGDRATLTFAAAGADVTPVVAPDLTLTITGSLSLPWADRDRPWDSAAAQRRIVAHCGGQGNLNPQCFSRAFMYREAGADPTLIGSYKFPFADIVDGRMVAVWRAVVAAAQRVDSAGITSADKDALRGRIRTLYRRVARSFGDDTITAPFDSDDVSHMTTGDTMGAKTATFQEEMPAAEVESQVMALAESIASSLAPQLSETISQAITAAIQQVVDAATGQIAGDMTDGDDLAEQVADATDDTVANEELSAVVLRMARAHARHALVGAR